MRKAIIEILDRINIVSELEDFDTIHKTIEKDLVFKGTNLWILVFAIVVASVGLNTNSTAVIIGAMLISPLMGPINGMGYSIATYDFELLRRSIKNFTFAVVASLIASTTYFAISPISTAHSELLARTSPSIYDVLIALFGGLAGIVAITSRQKGNVIPGVAIATALMPPLCTAGYGLATGQFGFFFGAIYLFTINTVFIAISSVVMSQVLKFPIRTLVDEAQKKRVNQWISVIIALVFIPSIYFGYNLVQQEKFNENANKYTRNVSVVEGNYLLKSEINPQRKTILLVYGGTTLSEEQKERIRERANDFSLGDVTIDFQQGFSFDELAKASSEVDNLKGEINRLSLIIQDKDRELLQIEEKQKLGAELFREISTIYPFLESGTYTESYVFGKDEKAEKIEIVIFNSKKPVPETDAEKIRKWLEAKLKSDKIKVYFEYK
jgi:uncharacterized hydrophobic protein (TIGR00271 family)